MDKKLVSQVLRRVFVPHYKKFEVKYPSANSLPRSLPVLQSILAQGSNDFRESTLRAARSLKESSWNSHLKHLRHDRSKRLASNKDYPSTFENVAFSKKNCLHLGEDGSFRAVGAINFVAEKPRSALQRPTDRGDFETILNMSRASKIRIPARVVFTETGGSLPSYFSVVYDGAPAFYSLSNSESFQDIELREQPTVNTVGYSIVPEENESFSKYRSLDLYDDDAGGREHPIGFCRHRHEDESGSDSLVSADIEHSLTSECRWRLSFSNESSRSPRPPLVHFPESGTPHWAHVQKKHNMEHSANESTLRGRNIALPRNARTAKVPPTSQLPDQKRSSAFEAAEKGDAGTLRALLVEGFPIEVKCNSRETLLGVASRRGQLEVVRLLLEKGADPNTFEQGHSPLVNAVDKNHMHVVEELLSSGAAVDQSSSDGMTALLTAANQGNEKMVQFLCKQGADLEAEDSQGHTPLLLAAKAGAFEAIQILINAGANPLAKNNEGQCALTLCLEAESLRLNDTCSKAISEPRGCREQMAVFLAENGADLALRIHVRTEVKSNGKAASSKKQNRMVEEEISIYEYASQKGYKALAKKLHDIYEVQAEKKRQELLAEVEEEEKEKHKSISVPSGTENASSGGKKKKRKKKTKSLSKQEVIMEMPKIMEKSGVAVGVSEAIQRSGSSSYTTDDQSGIVSTPKVEGGKPGKKTKRKKKKSEQDRLQKEKLLVIQEIVAQLVDQSYEEIRAKRLEKKREKRLRRKHQVAEEIVSAIVSAMVDHFVDGLHEEADSIADSVGVESVVFHPEVTANDAPLLDEGVSLVEDRVSRDISLWDPQGHFFAYKDIWQSLVASSLPRLHWKLVEDEGAGFNYNVHQAVLLFYESNRLSSLSLQGIRTHVCRIESALNREYPSAELAVFGSMSTGLWLRRSDLDLVALFQDDGDKELPERKLGISKLRHLCTTLSESGWVRNVQLIETATVPVLKFESFLEDHGSISVDLSVALGSRNGVSRNSTHQGMATRDYIRRILQRMDALGPLVLIIKEYLSECGLKDAFCGGVSSYSLVLMCYFIVLRELKPDPESPFVLRSAGPSYARGRWDLSSLLFRFFEFFGRHFMYGMYGISVFGDVAMEFKQTHFPLFVENPLQQARNVSASTLNVDYLKHVFEQGLILLEQEKRIWHSASSSGVKVVQNLLSLAGHLRCQFQTPPVIFGGEVAEGIAGPVLPQLPSIGVPVGLVGEPNNPFPVVAQDSLHLEQREGMHVELKSV
mmetsp:Transcript_6030/g.14648  ORF Transcript_6030/g.14648 Transcript_6030/m.14648 type:complete len:1256 (-) Transcript_6030:644-4411(-)